MRYAIAIWNYCWNAEQLVGAVNDFANAGFDTISFHPDQFAGAGADQLPAVIETLRRRALNATVHGSVAMEPRVMATLAGAFGETLRVFSMDSALCQDSRGTLHDARRIAAALTHLQELTHGTDVWIAVEDFPLDSTALEFFAGELQGVYHHPRTGILVDVGHMHMRMRSAGSFAGMSVADYFSRLPVPLVEVHLHDNNGERDQHGHFGYGSVPFGEIAAALRAQRFDGISTIEVAPALHNRPPHESKPDALASLTQWRQFMGVRHRLAT